MNKIKLGVIFGGMSTENEVSCISGTSVIRHLDDKKYDIYPIYIDKKGDWFKVNNILKEGNRGKELEDKVLIENIIDYLRTLDVVFPVLHGLYGEDGTIQGMLELLKIPYVGCKVLASSVGMDKVYTKVIFEKAGIQQAKYIYIRKSKNNEYVYIDNKFNEEKLELQEIVNIISEDLRFPMYVKPSNSGSSVGISRTTNKEELETAIEEASNYDIKILIEEEIKGREVECAVLGNEDVIASCVGEIRSADEFYSYDAKYNNQESKTIIPAEISEKQAEEIQMLAKKAFKVIDGKGLSRVDFFIEKGTEKIYINEINTLPGFTNISMYPKLFEATGISYSNLLDKVIKLSFED